jgi:hypothetical protein
METFIKAYMQMVSLAVLGNIIGQMEAILKDYLKTVYETDKVCGNEALEIAINIKDSMQMTKNVGMVFLHGQLVMYTKEIMNLM